MTDLLSTVSLTLFTVAAVREARARFPAIDGFLVWLCAGLVGIGVAFVAAVLLGPVDWRVAVLRGLELAAAAVGAVGTKKAITERLQGPAAKPDAAPTLEGVEVPVPTPETHGARPAMDLDFSDGGKR